jgi:allene oxide cyclase-like protein
MRRLAVAVLIAVVVGLIFAGATFAGGDHGGGHRGLTFFSTENALSLLPVTAGKFSLGDRVVFADDLFTAKGGTQVGTDGGQCTVVRVTDAATGSGVLQCLVTFSLPGGQITTQALNTLTNGGFAGAQTGAITGGTGKYRDAAGQFTVEFLSGGETNIAFFLDD